MFFTPTISGSNINPNMIRVVVPNRIFNPFRTKDVYYYIDPKDIARKIRERNENGDGVYSPVEIYVNEKPGLSATQKRIAKGTGYSFKHDNTPNNWYIASLSGVNYFAAGVLLFALTSGNIPVVLLFEPTNNASRYFVISGNIQKQDNGNDLDLTLRNTAVREINEETANLFVIDKGHLSDSKSTVVDVTKKNYNFKCYYIGLGTINETDIVTKYNSNLNLIKATRNSSWVGTSSVKIFPLANFVSLSSSLTSDPSVKDINNNSYNVYYETANIIKSIIGSNNPKDYCNGINLTTTSKNTSGSFLNGTESFRI